MPRNVSKCRVALTSQGRNAFPIRFLPHARKTQDSWAHAQGRWWLQRDSNPCFSLERVGSWAAVTGTYSAVATSGCHPACELGPSLA
jgi:hypothetical protein